MGMKDVLSVGEEGSRYLDSGKSSRATPTQMHFGQIFPKERKAGSSPEIIDSQGLESMWKPA